MQPRSNHWRAMLAVLGTTLLVAGPAAAPARAQQMQMMQFGMTEMKPGQAELFRKLLPSVVNINIRKDVAQNSTGSAMASGATETKSFFGSGFVIDPSGVIATNYHVVEGAWEIIVTFYDGTRVPGHLLKASRLIDVATIKVDVDHPLPVMKWGDSDKLQVGDPVFAIGNALNVGISVSGGLVSGLNRDIMESPYDDFIQTDAAINHGNSGGPLVNLQGEVVGIDNAIISQNNGWSGLGFAIPANSARTVIDRLMNYGWLRPGWVGMKIQQVTTDMAAALGMPKPEGSIVADVMPNSPAAAAGLRVGDVILQVGGKTPSDERALLRAVATAPVGENLTFGLWRDGKQQPLDIAVKEWPRQMWDALDAPDEMANAHHHVAPDLGLRLATLDDATRNQYGVTEAKTGAVVTGVAPGSDAALHGLAPGDVILRVQETPVATPADAFSAIDAARTQQRHFIVALIQAKVHDKPGPEWIALRASDD